LVESPGRKGNTKPFGGGKVGEGALGERGRGVWQNHRGKGLGVKKKKKKERGEQ